MLNTLKNWKSIKRILFGIAIVFILLISSVIGLLYYYQDKVVQELLVTLNKDFNGHIQIKESHISLFENFPYISIDLEEVVVHENKQKNTTPLVLVHDVYIGFDLWTILSGKMEICKVKLKDGNLSLVQHTNGEFNIVKALSSDKEIEDPESEFHLDLREIEFERIDLTKLNEENGLLLEAFITEADSKFKTSPDHIAASLDAQFELNIIAQGDTTIIRHKRFEVSTDLDYVTKEQKLTIQPTTVNLGDADFNMEGSLDMDDDLNLDLKFEGNKPNFNLLIALAPEAVTSMNKYENSGEIYFNASVKGKSLNGHNPAIDVSFGCVNAYFKNVKAQQTIDKINFKGHFSNGARHDLSTMELSIEEISMRPGKGTFSGNIFVKNFNEPEINLQLNTDLHLDFFTSFFELGDSIDLKGKLALALRFNDVINLDAPEKSIEKLNESYYTQLKIQDLSLSAKALPMPVKDLDLHIEVEGHKASIDYLNIITGKSDVSISGTISDLPAIIHHTSIPVTSDLHIRSKVIDLFELTGSDTASSVNEQITNLSMDFKFISSAKAITESPHLPVGDFYIENLYAKLHHYPHTFHDFHANIHIGEEELKIVDFKGIIDESNFLFSGKVNPYDIWFAEQPKGDTQIEFNFTSDDLHLDNLFSYQGENFVPEDYRHEELKRLKLHGYTMLHFKDSLHSIDLNLDKFEATMKIHPLHFENFKGRIHYENEHLVVEKFSGKLGKSDFSTTLHYYLGENESVRKRDNHFALISNHLDFDQLFNYNPPPVTDTIVDHEDGFNIYKLPFTNMTFDVQIGHLNYHRYLLHHINAKLHTTPQHYLYIDKLTFDAAGGDFDISGYFNGSNPDLIYLSPKVEINHVDLDKLMFKFENFGQDHLVSENLHGKLSGRITGKIHMHADLVPKIDDSEIHMDLLVTNGKLVNYNMLESMSNYFSDKNLKMVLFDTLANHIDMDHGVLKIPTMTINSSLGFMEISGTQDAEYNMDYYLKIPWKMVTQTAASKLFGNKKAEVDPNQIDAIQYADPEKKIWYVNIRIKGTTEDYTVSLAKAKKIAQK